MTKLTSPSRLLAIVVAILLLMTLNVAHAGNGLTVDMPNGYVTIKNNDLELDSLGGKVSWRRFWDGQVWRFNSQWESLSQTWENATCSQTPLPNGAWQWVNVDSLGTSEGSGAGQGSSTVGQITPGATPGSVAATNPVSAKTTLPFNQVMSSASVDYPPLTSVDTNIAGGCLGSTGAAGNLEGIRRQNELYVGQAGHFAFNNSTVLDMRAVKGLPQLASVSLDTQLATGAMTIAPVDLPKGFRWTHKNGDWIDYNLRGQVVAYGDANNNITWMARDTEGLLRGVVDGNGRVLIALNYTGELLTGISDFQVSGNSLDLSARTVSYQYDTSNRLNKVTDVRGNTTRYDYDAQNRITFMSDPEGHFEQFAYTGKTLSQHAAADGGVTDYAFGYDDANQQYNAKTTDPLTASGRRVEDNAYDNSGKLIRKIVNGRTDDDIIYDTAARTETHTNARGFKTVYTRNEFEQVTRIDNPDGTNKQYTYSAQNQRLTEEIDEGGVRTQYDYDSKGNLLKKTEAVGTADQRVTEYQVNSLGKNTQITLKGRTETNGTVTPDAITLFEYNTLGQIVKTTDPEGGVTKFSYDRVGHLLSQTDPLDHTTHFEIDEEGKLLKMTDPESRVTSYSYDKAGNLISATDARGKVSQSAYDAMNRLLQTTNAVGGVAKSQYNTAGMKISETDEDGRTNQFEYDNFYRLTQQLDALDNKTQFGYNLPDGSLGSLSLPTEIKFPTFTQIHRFDSQDRETSQTILNPNHAGTENITTANIYDTQGRLKTEQDANGKLHTYRYNAFGQVIEYTDSLGHKTTDLYDIRGNRIQLTDANGNTHKMVHDRNNRVIKEILPLGQATTYSYDAAGNLSQRVNPNGHKTTSTYDASNWLSEIKQYIDDSQLVRTTTLTWDAAHNLVAWSDTDATRPDGQQIASGSAIYDDNNRKTQETITYPNPQGQSYSLNYHYQYTLAGKKTKLVWPDGTAIDYGYSEHGQLKTVAIPGEGILSINQYQWIAPSAITLPGGTSQEKTYDGLLKLEGLKVKNPTQQPLLELTNSYNKRQELFSRSRTDTPQQQSTTFTNEFSYDDESRLVEAITDKVGSLFGSDTETFTLDGVGNRTSHSKVLGSWDYDANNRLLEKGILLDNTRYTYDAAGNLTSKTKGNLVTQFRYDTQNRLVQVLDGSGNLIAAYGYDPFDRRLWKERYRTKDGLPLSQPKRSYYLYADEGLLAESRQDISLNIDQTVSASAAPEIFSQYGVRPNSEFGTGVLFVKTKNTNGSDAVAYYQHDHLATPIQATDRSGNVVWSAQYNAFGRAVIITPEATADKPTIGSELRLPGQVEDLETGLHYNLHRYYEPDVGRYVTADPIGLSGGINIYAYANLNPLMYKDQEGLLPKGGNSAQRRGAKRAQPPGPISPSQNDPGQLDGFSDAARANLCYFKPEVCFPPDTFICIEWLCTPPGIPNGCSAKPPFTIRGPTFVLPDTSCVCTKKGINPNANNGLPGL